MNQNNVEESVDEVPTNEIYDKSAIRRSTRRLMEEGLTIRQDGREKCCRHAASI